MKSLLIPTYIINLKKRTDRRNFVRKQFLNKIEFDLRFVSPIEDTIPAVSLYKTLHCIIQEAKNKNYPFVLICEDDHKFTDDYIGDSFLRSVIEFENANAHILLGGVSWFDHSIKKDSRHYWVNNFTGAQFMIIYSRFFDMVLKTSFSKDDTIDRWISILSDRIFVMVPMISIQKEFGYSDVTIRNDVNGRVNELFLQTRRRWKALSAVHHHIEKNRFKNFNKLNVGEIEDLQLNTYVIVDMYGKHNLPNLSTELSKRRELNISLIDIYSNVQSHDFTLWMGIKNVINIAIEKNEDIILICGNNHRFTESYDCQIFFQTIYQGAFLGADILIGACTDYGQAIVVDDQLCWIDSFKFGTQFIVIYKKFYNVILEAKFEKNDQVDVKLSDLTNNKYIIHPFISIRTKADSTEMSNMNNCSEKLNFMRTKQKQIV